jgi:F-type H+-transporting ATPase subunit delta
MPRPTSAARRYAEAAFEIARRDGTLDAWQSGLARAVATITDPQVAGVVDSPAVPFTARREILSKLLATEISPTVLNLVLLLAQRGKLASLVAVEAQFARLVDRERGIVPAEVTSAAPLGPDELAAIAARVSEITGSRVDLRAAVNPDLIGGLTVRVGDRLIDASVRGRLERLRDRLVAGAR